MNCVAARESHVEAVRGSSSVRPRVVAAPSWAAVTARLDGALGACSRGNVPARSGAWNGP